MIVPLTRVLRTLVKLNSRMVMESIQRRKLIGWTWVKKCLWREAFLETVTHNMIYEVEENIL